MHEYIINYIDDRLNEPNTVILDSTSKGFFPLETDAGQLLIALESTKPYLNGYKLEILIGNPSNITYEGFKVILKYNMSQESFAKKNNRENTLLNLFEWGKSMKTKEIVFTDKLKPGYWNKFQLPIVPATAEELEYIELSLDIDTIVLK